MEVESGGDSGAAGSSGQSGIDRGESRGDMVGGGSYAEEDDELMLEYMGNEGVGDEEIDRFMGWTTVDLRGERFSGPRPSEVNQAKRSRGRRGGATGVIAAGSQKDKENEVAAYVTAPQEGSEGSEGSEG